MQEVMKQRASQFDRFERLCSDLGESASAIALAWLLHQPVVSATTIGPGNIAQLNSVFHVPDIFLDTETLAKSTKFSRPVVRLQRRTPGEIVS